MTVRPLEDPDYLGDIDSELLPLPPKMLVIRPATDALSFLMLAHVLAIGVEIDRGDGAEQLQPGE